MSTYIRSFRAAVCGLMVWSFAAAASAQHFDVFVTNLGTLTGVGGADVGDGHFDLETRVFESVLIAGGGADYTRDEPGFFALSNLAPGGLFPSGASALPPNVEVTFSPITFNFDGNTSALFYWDGTGELHFQPAIGSTFSLSDSSELADANGVLDFHPDFQIDDPVGTPPDGVYVASLSATAAGLAPSKPIYLVLLVDASITDELIAEEMEEAIEAGEAFEFFELAAEYVESSLVPEPASLAVLGTAVGLLALSRRRISGRTV